MTPIYDISRSYERLRWRVVLDFRHVGTCVGTCGPSGDIDSGGPMTVL